MSKVAGNSTAFNKTAGRVEDVKLHVSNRTLQELFKTALIKPVAFVVFEILHNLFPCKTF